MDDESNSEDGNRQMRWLLIVIAVCIFIIMVPPALVTAQPAPVRAIAIWGGIAATLVGIIAGLVRIVWTKGKPLGSTGPLAGPHVAVPSARRLDGPVVGRRGNGLRPGYRRCRFDRVASQPWIRTSSSCDCRQASTLSPRPVAPNSSTS